MVSRSRCVGSMRSDRRTIANKGLVGTVATGRSLECGAVVTGHRLTVSDARWTGKVSLDAYTDTTDTARPS